MVRNLSTERDLKKDNGRVYIYEILALSAPESAVNDWMHHFLPKLRTRTFECYASSVWFDCFDEQLLLEKWAVERLNLDVTNSPAEAEHQVLRELISRPWQLKDWIKRTYKMNHTHFRAVFSCIWFRFPTLLPFVTGLKKDLASFLVCQKLKPSGTCSHEFSRAWSCMADFEFWLVRVVYVSYDWSEWLLWFWFYNTRLNNENRSIDWIDVYH